jgi:hypothetical protein
MRRTSSFASDKNDNHNTTAADADPAELLLMSLLLKAERLEISVWMKEILPASFITRGADFPQGRPIWRLIWHVRYAATLHRSLARSQVYTT